MQWLAKKPVPGFDCGTDASSVNDAGFFLNHAADYANLVDYFEMKERGSVTAHVDPASKTVTFNFPTPESGIRSLEGFVDNIAVFGRLSGEMAGPEFERLARDAFRMSDPLPVVVHEERFTLQDPFAATSSPVRAFVRRQWPPRMYEVDDDQDLAGFTAGQLNLFWEAVGAWSFACLRAFYRMHAQRQPLRPFPTQCVEINLFEAVVGAAVPLPSSVIRAIIDRLRFATEDRSFQPFLVHEDQIAWSPSVIMTSRFQRNTLKLMCRIPSLRDATATIIGAREGRLLHSVGDMLAKRGWSYSIGRKLRQRREGAN